MNGNTLNYKQDMFTHYYTREDDTKGNATQSAIKAGYAKRTAYSVGQRLLKYAEVKRVIDEITAEIKANSVATRILRQEFWTKTMNDKEASMSDRLRASELLGKSEADFTENYADKSVEQPKEFTPAQIAELKRLADFAEKLDEKPVER